MQIALSRLRNLDTAAMKPDASISASVPVVLPVFREPLLFRVSPAFGEPSVSRELALSGESPVSGVLLASGMSRSQSVTRSQVDGMVESLDGGLGETVLENNIREVFPAGGMVDDPVAEHGSPDWDGFVGTAADAYVCGDVEITASVP